MSLMLLTNIVVSVWLHDTVLLFSVTSWMGTAEGIDACILVVRVICRREVIRDGAVTEISC